MSPLKRRLLVALGIALAIWLLPFPGRYGFVGADHGFLYRTDRVTGAAWSSHYGDAWRRIESPSLWDRIAAATLP